MSTDNEGWMKVQVIVDLRLGLGFDERYKGVDLPWPSNSVVMLLLVCS